MSVEVRTLDDGARFWAAGRYTRRVMYDEPGRLAAVPADGGALVWYKPTTRVTPKTDGKPWLR